MFARWITKTKWCNSLITATWKAHVPFAGSCCWLRVSLNFDLLFLWVFVVVFDCVLFF